MAGPSPFEPSRTQDRDHRAAGTRPPRGCNSALPHGTGLSDSAPGHGRCEACHEDRQAARQGHHAQLHRLHQDRDARAGMCHPFPGRQCPQGGCEALPRTISDHRHHTPPQEYRRKQRLRRQATATSIILQFDTSFPAVLAGHDTRSSTREGYQTPGCCLVGNTGPRTVIAPAS